MKQKIKEKFFSKWFNGDLAVVRFSDLPKDIKNDDIIDIYRNEAFHSENDSYDAYTELVIIRERDETDAEYEYRRFNENEKNELLKKRRYNEYLKLKAEFE